MTRGAIGATDLVALLPWLLLAGGALAALLAVSFGRRGGGAAWWSLGGIAAAAASYALALPLAPRPVANLLLVDGFSLFFLGIVLISGLAVGLLARDYLRGRETPGGEFWILLPLGLLGAGVLTAATSLVTLFLGVETLSIALYGLIAYLRREPRSLEAGLKYLVLAGASSAFLLLGMALLYAAAGTLRFDLMRPLLEGRLAPLAGPGLALLLAGLGFKLAVVPFHMWTPDVYVGAPAPVTALVATASKGAVLAVMLRLFHGLGLVEAPLVATIVAVLAILSMLAGNLLALLQTNLKRILAYSSIAHLGYMLVAFLAAGELGPVAVGYYLVAYTVTTLGAFGVVAALERGREAEDLADLRGLLWRRPWPAALLTACLLSLAGIPLTAGFIGKYLVVAAGVGDRAWSLVLVLVVGSAIGIVYYLRVIVAMIGGQGEAHAGPTSAAGPMPAATPGPAPGPAPVASPVASPAAAMPALSAAVLVVMFLLLIGLGVWPAPLQALLQGALAGL